MKKIIIAMTLGILAVGSLKADEPSKPESTTTLLMNWFSQLEQSLSESSVSQNYENRNDLVAVAAVRGSKQNLADINQPTWEKSNISQREKLLKERKEFAAAVKEVVSGKLKEAQADLNSFEKSHPSSPLIKDVKKAEEKIAELQKLNLKGKPKAVKTAKKTAKIKKETEENKTQANP